MTAPDSLYRKNTNPIKGRLSTQTQVVDFCRVANFTFEGFFFSVSLYQSPQVGHHMGANPWTLSRPLPSSYLFTLVTVNPTTRWRWQFILPASAYLARLSGGAIGSSLGELWGCSTPKTYTKINGFYYANTSSRKVIRSGYGLEICWVTEIGSPWVNFYRQCRQWRVLYCSILRLIAVLSPSPYLFLSFMTGILG